MILCVSRKSVVAASIELQIRITTKQLKNTFPLSKCNLKKIGATND